MISSPSKKRALDRSLKGSTQSSDRAVSTYLTGGGGFTFEQRVQAYFLLQSITKGHIDENSKIETSSRIRLQARQNYGTDDLVINFQDQHGQPQLYLCQIKHKLDFNKNEDTRKSIQFAWDDIIKHKKITYGNGKILFISGLVSQVTIDHVRMLFIYANQATTATDFYNRITGISEKEQAKLKVIEDILKEYDKAAVTQENVWQFLRVIDFITFTLDYSEGSVNLQLILDKIQLCRSYTAPQAHDVWLRLCEFIRSRGITGIDIDVNELPENIISCFKLAEHTRINPNIPEHSVEFIGRKQYLEELNSAVNKCQGTQSNRLIGICGEKGIGKTYLAAYFAKSCGMKVVWFPAENDEVLYNDYRRFIEDELHESMHNINNEELKKKLKRFFHDEADTIIIFDNVPDAAFIKDHAPFSNIKIATVSTHTWPAPVINLEVMSTDEAFTLLKQEAYPDGSDSDDPALQVLVEKLGCLPLALAQVGAYMHCFSINETDFLKEYDSSRKEILSDEELHKRGEHEPVYKTWDLTFSKLQSNDRIRFGQETLTTINHLSFLYADAIPQEFIKVLVHEETAKHVIKNLNQLALARFNRQGKTLSIHRVLQDVIREKLEENNQFKQILCNVSVEIISLLNYNHLNQVEVNQAQVYLVHAKNLIEIYQCKHIENIELFKLYYLLARFKYHIDDDLSSAEQYEKKAREISQNLGNIISQSEQSKLDRLYGKILIRLKRSDEAKQYACSDLNSFAGLCDAINYYLFRVKKYEFHAVDIRGHFHQAAFEDQDAGKKVTVPSTSQESFDLALAYKYIRCAESTIEKDNLAQQAQLAHYKGNYFKAAKRYFEAIEFFQDSLKKKKSLFGATPHFEIVRTLHQLAKCQILSFDFNNAIKNLETADVILREINKDRATLKHCRILHDLVNACLKSNKKTDDKIKMAIDLLDRAIFMREKLPGNCTVYVRKKAKLLYENGENESAISLLDKYKKYNPVKKQLEQYKSQPSVSSDRQILQFNATFEEELHDDEEEIIEDGVDNDSESICKNRNALFSSRPSVQSNISVPQQNRFKTMRMILEQNGFSIDEAGGNGNCLFLSIAKLQSIADEDRLETANLLRIKVCDYLNEHKNDENNSLIENYKQLLDSNDGCPIILENQSEIIVRNFDDYIRYLRMPGTYAMGNDVQVLANVLNLHITICCETTKPSQHKASVQSFGSETQHNLFVLYYNGHNHYQAVTHKEYLQITHDIIESQIRRKTCEMTENTSFFNANRLTFESAPKVSNGGCLVNGDNHYLLKESNYFCVTYNTAIFYTA